MLKNVSDGTWIPPGNAMSVLPMASFEGTCKEEVGSGSRKLLRSVANAFHVLYLIYEMHFFKPHDVRSLPIII